MDKTFPSKVDAWLRWMLWIGLIAAMLGSIPLLFAPDYRFKILALVVVVTAVVFPVWMLRATYYTILGDLLLVRCGPFRWRVPIGSIVAIIPTHDALSSPALSLDRLKIKYGGGKSLMVSPEDKDAFVAALKEAGAKI